MNTGVALSVRRPAGLLNKLYTLCVAIVPMLAMYASGIPGFSLADVVLFMFTFIAALNFSREDNNKFGGDVKWLFCGMVLILAFDVVVMLVDSKNLYDVIIRTVRYGFYIFCFAFTSKKLIDVELLKKYVKNITLLSTLYIFLQYVMYKLGGIVLRGFIPWLPLYNEEYALRDYETLYQTMYRPTSLFLEPAHFSRYAIIGLIIILWRSDLNFKDILLGVMVSFGVLLSTSSQGYLLLAVVWLLFALTRATKIKSDVVKLIIIIGVMCAPVLIYIIFTLPYVQETILRSLSGSISDSNSALGGRLSGFLHFGDLSWFNKIFGAGFGNIPESGWLSSAAYWLYGGGIIIFAIYLIFLLASLVKLKRENKMIFLIVFILFFSDDSFYSSMCVLFYSLSLLTEVVSHEKNTVYSDGVGLS